MWYSLPCPRDVRVDWPVMLLASDYERWCSLTKVTAAIAKVVEGGAGSHQRGGTAAEDTGL